MRTVILVTLALYASTPGLAMPPFGAAITAVEFSHSDGSRISLRTCGRELCELRVELNGVVLEASQSVLDQLVDPLIETTRLYYGGGRDESGFPSAYLVIAKYDDSIEENGVLGPYYEVELSKDGEFEVGVSSRLVNWL